MNGANFRSSYYVFPRQGFRMKSEQERGQKEVSKKVMPRKDLPWKNRKEQFSEEEGNEEEECWWKEIAKTMTHRDWKRIRQKQIKAVWWSKIKAISWSARLKNKRRGRKVSLVEILEWRRQKQGNFHKETMRVCWQVKSFKNGNRELLTQI